MWASGLLSLLWQSRADMKGAMLSLCDCSLKHKSEYISPCLIGFAQIFCHRRWGREPGPAEEPSSQRYGYFGFLLPPPPPQWLDKYLEHCKYPVTLCLVKEADCSYKSWTEKAHCSFPTLYARPQITFHPNLAMAKMWVASLSLWPYYISCTTSQP